MITTTCGKILCSTLGPSKDVFDRKIFLVKVLFDFYVVFIYINKNIVYKRNILSMYGI